MLESDPGSFRDPASHIVFEGDRVVRLLDDRGLDGWKALVATSFHTEATESGRLIASTPVESPPAGTAGALEHPRLPFISYPYEWTFSMLKDAALLQLELLESALGAGLTIKDATPFNIQFVAGKPMFIDVGSFETYREGEPWIGYRQFTRQFLFPLMLRSWAGVPFQPWLRGNMEGPTAGEMKQILPRGRRMTPAGMLHVSLQARMEEQMSGAAVREQLKTAGFNKDLILANVRKLHKLVTGLDWDGTGQGWVEYEACSHVERDRETKGTFLQIALDRHEPRRVLDLGANDGYFSEIATSAGATTVAVDGDEQVLDALYRRGTKASLVLGDLTNPSPSQGWAGQERPGLMRRADPQLIVAYGLIHHLIYTASIPPATVVDWLGSFDCPVVVEFVSPEDEMVAKLTANKSEAELHPGRTQTEFEALLQRHFTTTMRTPLGDGIRQLYSLAPLSG